MPMYGRNHFPGIGDLSHLMEHDELTSIQLQS
jgi:hypothetical protein